MSDQASSAGGNGERASSLLSPRQRAARTWLASQAATGVLSTLSIEEILDVLARETGVVIPKTDSFVIMLTLQRLAADEAYARQTALAEAQAEVAGEMRLVLEQFRAAVKDAPAVPPPAPAGGKAVTEQVTDRPYPGVKVGTPVLVLVQAALAYRKERDELRKQVEELKASKGDGRG